MIRHATADTYLWCRFPDGRWRVGLIDHPRLGVLMPPGGHGEPNENSWQTAFRELREETGLRSVRFLLPGHETTPRLPDYCTVVSPPWWIVEQQVQPDSRTPHDHIHTCAEYVAVVSYVDLSDQDEPEHDFQWYDPALAVNLWLRPECRAMIEHLVTRLEYHPDVSLLLRTS